MSSEVKAAIFGSIIAGVFGLVGIILSWYLTVQSTTKNNIEAFSQYFESVDKDMKIEEVAKSIYTENQKLKNEINDLKDNNKDLLDDINSVKKIVESNNDDKTKEIIEIAKTYAGSSEFNKAIQQLQKIKENTPEIDNLLNEYVNLYEKDIITNVDDLVMEHKHKDALILLKNSLLFLPNSENLKLKKQEVEKNLPVKLSTIKISSSRFFDVITEKRKEDTVGNVYSPDNLYIIYADREGYGNANYFLDKNYKYISGLISVSDESQNRSDVVLEGWIEIYTKVDGVSEMVFKTPVLNRATSPINFNDIYINNAEWLEIRYYDPHGYSSLIDGYISLKVILSDFTLYN